MWVADFKINVNNNNNNNINNNNNNNNKSYPLLHILPLFSKTD